MPDDGALAALGLEPSPEGEEESTETPASETPEETPETPEAPETSEETIEVPEGANNPDAVKNAIQAERKRAREANARARDLERQLREREEDKKPLEERISAADQKAAEADARALRLEVALDLGLSTTLARRLQGTTKDELVADAEALLSEVGTRKPGMDGGYKTDPPKPTDPQRAHSDFIAGLLTQSRAGQ